MVSYAFSKSQNYHPTLPKEDHYSTQHKHFGDGKLPQEAPCRWTIKLLLWSHNLVASVSYWYVYILGTVTV